MKLLLGFILSLAFELIAMPKLIPFLQKIKYGQSISEYSLDDFKAKAGTPTMGGTTFVVFPIVAFIILNPTFYKSLSNVLIILAYIGYGLIGFLDDYIIVVEHDNAGLSARNKFALQLLLSVIFYFVYRQNCISTIHIPFTNLNLDLGWAYAILVFFMFTGASNAVNLTDGMDGLAAGVSFITILPFVYIAYKLGEKDIAVLLCCVLGGLLGYLKYNFFPAKIFMGDAGSLALGGLLASVALVLKQEFALVIIAGVFVIETACVIIQIGSVKLFHKRVFRYTPIHYAFRLEGIPERKVVLLFWAAAAVCAIAGFVIGAML